MPKPQAISHADKAELADASAQRLLDLLSSSLEEENLVHLSLTGGTMGIAIWDSVRKLVEAGNKLDWSRVHFWWSDERFVETGHVDRNELQAKAAFLGPAGIAVENLHIMGAADVFATVEDAAADYTRELKEFAEDGQVSPRFALSLLGMGPDGHIASLFPNRPEILDQSQEAIAIEDSPKPPPTRVSLTLPIIKNSDAIWFLIAGSDKAEATARLLQAADLEQDDLTDEVLTETPAAGARGLQETLILATEDALNS